MNTNIAEYEIEEAVRSASRKAEAAARHRNFGRQRHWEGVILKLRHAPALVGFVTSGNSFGR